MSYLETNLMGNWIVTKWWWFIFNGRCLISYDLFRWPSQSYGIFFYRVSLLSVSHPLQNPVHSNKSRSKHCCSGAWSCSPLLLTVRSINFHGPAHVRNESKTGPWIIITNLYISLIGCLLSSILRQQKKFCSFLILFFFTWLTWIFRLVVKVTFCFAWNALNNLSSHWN